VKKNGMETMEILEAFDKTKSAHSAAKLAGCDPKTVRRLVARREAGLGADAPIDRPRLVDGYTEMVGQLVDGSEGTIRADVAHEKLVACGYTGSPRTTRRAVGAAKARWRVEHARSNRPWITVPGMWLQFDWGDGPKVRDLTGRLRSTVLFVGWVAWSRFRVVIPCWDQTSESLATCLDSTFRLVGGVTDYVLTDNAKTVTVTHIAGVPVRHPLMVEVGRHYGTTVHTCVPYDPQSKGGVAKDDLLPKKTNLRAEYASMDELAVACGEFMAKVNGRVHQTTRRRPEDALAAERAFLHPVPAEPHTAALGQARVVAPDQTISFGSVRYSVPARLQGARVWVAVQGEEVVIRADARQLAVVPDWAQGHGLVEVARHRASTPGNPRINLAHYPDHPQNPDGTPALPRPRAGSLLEQVFLSIGPSAELWLVSACALGVERIESKMRSIVDLAALRGSELTCHALEAAAQAGRFGWGDVESIAEFLATTGRDDNLRVVADEGSSTQPGTGGWAGFTTTGIEAGR
jgi:transposase